MTKLTKSLNIFYQASTDFIFFYEYKVDKASLKFANILKLMSTETWS